jgi:hypothetical protein
VLCRDTKISDYPELSENEVFSSAYCIPDDYNDSLNWNVNSPDYRSLSIFFQSCKQGQGVDCKSEEEINEFLSTHPFFLSNLQPYIDASDKENPIKHSVNVAYFK